MDEISFGNWLKQYRHLLDLTQRELAKQVGYAVITIRKLEKDAIRPSKDMAARLADRLNIPADEKAAFIEFARARASATRVTPPLHPTSRTRFKPWRLSRPHPVNLPSPLTSFIGREKELFAVGKHLLHPGTRLLTLTGPPGIGKTRLSIQVATELRESFEDGICFVSLAPIEEPEFVARTISQVVGIPESGDWEPITALKDYFCNKHMLLVLDNFEHLLPAAAPVAKLLHACPALKILTTSREPLKISGERQYPVGPLPVPDLDHSPAFEVLKKYPSIELFVARSNLIDPDFRLTEENIRLVAEICCHLDGLPLAIELAAAWTKFLPLQELLARLSSSLFLLKDGPIDLPPRQRTLRAAIDWSYRLLDAWEQALFVRLAVFVGGWTLEAAEAVAKWNDGHEDQIGSVWDGLLALVDKSLVERQADEGDGVRFALLETIREYAWEKLAARGEMEILQRRHAGYFLKFTKMSEPALRGAQQKTWLTRLKAEHNNLRAALQWALDNQDVETSLKISGSLWFYWWFRGHYSEGRDWLEKALALTGPQQPAWRAKALNGLGILARNQGDFTNARTFLEESLAIQRNLEDWKGVANVLNSLGVLAQFQGDNGRALELHQEGLALRRKIEDKRGIAISLNNLAMVVQEKSEFVQAEELYRESLSLFQEVEDARGMAAALLNWGLASYDQKDANQAESRLRKSLEILKDLRQRNDIIECLEGFAGVAALLHQPHRAARLFYAAQALRDEIGAVVAHYHLARYQRIVESITSQLDSQILESECAVGREMSWEEVMEYALS